MAESGLTDASFFRAANRAQTVLDLAGFAGCGIFGYKVAEGVRDHSDVVAIRAVASGVAGIGVKVSERRRTGLGFFFFAACAVPF